MTPDLKRLCEAVLAVRLDGYQLPPDESEAIVRAVLKELREVSDEGRAAMEATLKRPREHVGHRTSDETRGAYIALDAYVDHILDTAGRREAALSGLMRQDGELL